MYGIGSILLLKINLVELAAKPKQFINQTNTSVALSKARLFIALV